LQSWLERNVISPLVDARVCVSQDILDRRRDLDGVPAAKLHCIANGTPLLEPVTIEDHHPARVGAVGRLVDAKDYVTLVQCARLLRQRGFDFRLTIVGEGPERARLEREIRQLALEDRVELPGATSDVTSWLKRFDIYVLSSIREGQPLSLLEAMAAGLPIVATQVGGIPDTLLDGEEALLIPPRDPDALATAISILFHDVGMRRRLGSRARERLIRDFSISVSSRRYRAIYEKILKEKKK
jgi:glycosyltransferase involved in cell wall biosynthesis